MIQIINDEGADGKCTGVPIDFSALAIYSIVENDFMASGGDGYPNVCARGMTQAILDQVLADSITARSPLAPSIQ